MMEEYWAENIPWAFNDVAKKPSYKERRAMRYALQDYMHKDIFTSDWKGKSILEVGCGSGIDAAEFASLGAKVFAVDPSDLAVKETESVSRESGLTILVEKAEADDLPYRNECFDMVYSFGVLHHIMNPRFAIREFHRVLKPGGQVIVMLYNSESLMTAYSHRLMGLPYEMRGNPYTQPYSKAEAKALFEKFFCDVSVTPRYNVIDTPHRRKVKFEMTYGGEDLGWHLIVRGTKC